MTIGIDLSGRTALVTGGSRGIGRAIALALAECGAAVAVNFRARTQEADAVVQQIRSAGGRAIAVRADVSMGAEVSELADHATRALGPIDVLINNAGIAIEDAGEQAFDRTLAANLKSAFLCTEAVLPGMRARHWGRIVNISSAAARGAGLVGVAYNASKAGLEGLTRGYAARAAKDGVTVNAVAPGPIDTEMAAPLKAGGVASRIPVGRMGQAEEVAQATVLVIGNGFLTGQTIAVNGGVAFL
ncbi:MAG TPA: SDR family NAD(P)-dependent oxidoreductase [Roseiarcus sp.]|jgi:3-oxoacyl-[acyl-carrier protein] reductase|nr:SDR family NAD(P)-dependent oxidoreductase [Roseiarcus sp.]